MPNKSGNLYGLSALCPILPGHRDGESFAAILRKELAALPLNAQSPFAKVPNTYFCRLFVLDNVVYQGAPAHLDQLESRYLVFTSNFYGDLEPYLRGMWEACERAITAIWTNCIGFEEVRDADGFIAYVKRCQVTTTFLFNGCTDEPLQEQLKSLYLKQELSKFVFEHQGKSPAELQSAFQAFVARTKPFTLSGPTWAPGASSLESAVVTGVA
jgi:hypothetical protein